MKKKKLSRQRLCQIRKNARGICAHCSEPLAEGSSTHCAHHREIRRNYSLKAQGCVPNPRAWMENKEAFFAELRTLDWANLTAEDVAKIYNVTKTTAYLWAKKLGIRRVLLLPNQQIVTKQ